MCCAERRLIASKVREAVQHGVPRAGIIHWVRRKFGKDMTIWRIVQRDANSELGCCVPCVLCRSKLIEFQMRVHVVTSDGEWYHGHMSDACAPVSKPTSGQKQMWLPRTQGI